MAAEVEPQWTYASTALVDLIEQTERDPARMAPVIDELLNHAISSNDKAAHLICLTAQSLGWRSAGKFFQAYRLLTQAHLLAHELGDTSLIELVGVHMVPVLVHRGQTDEALQQLDDLTKIARTESSVTISRLRATVLYSAGRMVEARDAFTVLIDELDDDVSRAKAIANRGTIYLELGNPTAAIADLVQAGHLFQVAGHTVEAARVLHNTGHAHARAGAIALALSCFHEAALSETTAGYNLGVGQLDRADVLLAGGLVEEAELTARSAATLLAGDGNPLHEANAWLLAAQAARLNGANDDGLAAAKRAEELFAAQGRRGWVTAARLEVFRCREASGIAIVADGVDIAESADREGMICTALTARLVAAIVAAETGARAEAHRLIDEADSARVLAASDRLLLHLARAKVNLDRPAVALAQARNGMNEFAAHQSTIGGTDVRANASRYGAALAELGLREALRADRPAFALSWLNRFRAGALRFPPAQPCADPIVADEFNQLRATVAKLRDADVSIDQIADLRSNRADLEQSIRDRMRRQQGNVKIVRQQPPSVRQLHETSPASTIISFVELDRELLSLTLRNGKVTSANHGLVRPILRELSSVKSALTILADDRSGPAARADAVLVARHSAATLDHVLLSALPDSNPLVIIPPGWMHPLPWAMLPSCHGRVITVAPSALSWWRARQRTSRPPDLIAIAGTGVRLASTEIAAVASSYSTSQLLQDNEATIQNVLGALGRFEVAHVVAHGTFRSDNPLFSALELVDGPLTVFELDYVATPPATVVLSACNSALSATRPGDELMGLCAALLAAGTSTLVAAVGPVPETSRVEQLMVSLHRGIVAGASPSTSLASAYSAFDPNDPEHFALRSFVPLGGG